MCAVAACRGDVISREVMMTRWIIAGLLTAFAIGSAAAQAPDTCASKAVGKNGRELSGVARTAFLTKINLEACPPTAIWIRRHGAEGRRENELHREVRERAGLSSRIALSRAIRVTGARAFATCNCEAADKKLRLSSFA